MGQFIREKFHNKIIFLDGATGSNLAAAGMPAGVCPEKWILENPDVFVALQKGYVEAGTNILYAPTFGANRIKLREYGLEDKIEEMNHALVALSRQAAGNQALVAGDITMTGVQLSPLGSLSFEELVDVYKEQIKYLVDAGCDLLVVETMMSLQETRAAVIAAKEVCELPVMATLSFEADGRTLYGTDPVTAALCLEGLGVDAVGVNCSVGPDKMVSVIESMYKSVSVPIIAKPNAGMPGLDSNGKTVYSMGPSEFAKECIALIEVGACIVGGCCGTGVEHIKELHNMCKDLSPLPAQYRSKRVLCSERQTLLFGLDDPFIVIGERINPTGKKAFQASIREGSMDMVSEFALQQEECNAAVLDVNLGMSGINEGEKLLEAMELIGTITKLPLSIDSSNCDVIEKALRVYPGRGLINSVSLEADKPERIFPLAKKYGATCILLPLSDAGLPKSLEEKKQIIEILIQKAETFGLSKRELIVDGLVTTISANPKAALETLETIRFCKENDLATVCGLSNISFGLPERKNINTAFLTTAIREGLTMAIANPCQKELMNAIYATDMLMNKENAALRYIENMTSNETTVPAAGAKEELPLSKQVYRAVLRGNETGIVTLTKALFEKNEFTPQEILNQCLLPAINEVGDLFNQGKYFLPQLIASANAMKLSIEFLEPFMKTEEGLGNAKTVVIATVKGDIHDIGKNLVALMLKNYGYRVLDLGKDVETDEIIRVAKEENADIIALSALMTTTMTEMQKVIQGVKNAGLDSKIMIGGAVITQDYADEILADGYAKDAAGAVLVANELSSEQNSKAGGMI